MQPRLLSKVDTYSYLQLFLVLYRNDPNTSLVWYSNGQNLSG